MNPNARKPRLKAPSLETLKALLGPNASIHVTQDLDELDRFMAGWALNDKQTLCFYGGDGSVARGLTSLIRHHGEEFELPPVLAIRAGTINMLCSVLDHREAVERTFDRWKNNEFNSLKVIPTIKVEVEGQEPQYGFIFAWGVGFRVVREIYSRGSAPDVFDSVAVATRTFALALGPQAEEQPLFKSESISLQIDGEINNLPMRALTIGTLPRVSLGIRPFAPEPIKPGGFHVSANGMSIFKIARHSGPLLFGRGDQRELESKIGPTLVSRTHVKRLTCELSEGFTMDGEIFELPKKVKVSVSAGPNVRFWTKSIT